MPVPTVEKWHNIMVDRPTIHISKPYIIHVYVNQLISHLGVNSLFVIRFPSLGTRLFYADLLYTSGIPLVTSHPGTFVHSNSSLSGKQPTMYKCFVWITYTTRVILRKYHKIYFPNLEVKQYMYTYLFSIKRSSTLSTNQIFFCDTSPPTKENKMVQGPCAHL
jgi:hypothetical protein